MKIPSPSGKEKAVGEYLLKMIDRRYKIKVQKVGTRFNVLVTVGKPYLILTTHMDTVSPQLAVREDRSYIYGRGACDAKGIIAAMLCAGQEAMDYGICNFGILLDVGEEADFSGIKEALKLVEPKQVVVGEPTNLRAVIGQKGLLGVKIACLGKSASGATPEAGISAIDQLVRILSAVNGLKLPCDPLLGDTVVNIGTVAGGVAPNVVADYAEADLEFRTSVPNSQVVRILNRIAGKRNVTLKYSFESAFAQNTKFLQGLGFGKMTVPYFTELFFWSQKANTFCFGPGDYSFAHSSEERIKKKDLESGKNAYLKIIKEFQGNQANDT